MTLEKDNFRIPALAVAAVILASSVKPEGSLILGLAAVLVTATVVFITRSRFSDNENKILATLLYLVLVTSSPCYPNFSQQHLATIFCSMSFLIMIDFCKFPDNTLSFALASLTLTATAVFWPPLLWLALAYLVLGIIRSDNKMKVAVSLILAVTMPVLIYFAVMYLQDNLDAGILTIKGKLEQVISLEDCHNIHLSMPTILKYLVIAAGIISVSCRSLFKMNIPSISERWIYLMTVVIFFSIIGICTVFYPAAGRSVTMTACPLSALLLSEYISGLKSKKASRIYLFLLIVTALSERLYDFNLDIL